MPVPATRTLRQAVLDRLALVANVKVYDGRIDQTNPPDVIPASGGVVRPYCILYAGGGRGYSDRLTGGSSALSWSAQVTVAAGYPADCAAAVDRVRAQLTDQPVTIPDGVTSHLREVADTGSIRVDEQISPARFYVPLIFQTVATP